MYNDESATWGKNLVYYYLGVTLDVQRVCYSTRLLFVSKHYSDPDNFWPKLREVCQTSGVLVVPTNRLGEFKSPNNNINFMI